MAATTIKNGFNGGSDDQLLVNPDGSINVTTSGGGGTDTNATIVGLSSFQTSQYTIGMSVIQLTPTPLTNRSSITIRVNKDNTGAIYIGPDNTVSTTTGYPLFSGDTLGMDLTSTNSIFAIADTINQLLAVLEIA